MERLKNSALDYIRSCDKVLWLLTFAAIIYSSLLIMSMQRGTDYDYLRIQLIAVFIGLVASYILSRADYAFLLRKWYVFAIAAGVMSALVFLFGMQVEGTDDTAWLVLPGGITVQPSEFIKICFIITFSKHLSYLKDKNLLENKLALLTLAAHAIVPMGIIHLQGDDGTVLVFGLIFITMSFLAGIQLRYFAILGGLLAAGIPLIWLFFMNDEHRSRILALLDLDGNALTNYGWQQYQGKVSIASGELTGQGLFNGSRVEYRIVPEQANDFIFTVAGEELGFIGCCVLLLLLLMIIVKCMMNIRRTDDFGGKMICSGVFALFAGQTIINIGMVLGFFPVIGITLPLFSAGGTSALATLLCIGLVQSVRTHNLEDIDTVKLKSRRRSAIDF